MYKPLYINQVTLFFFGVMASVLFISPRIIDRFKHVTTHIDADQMVRSKSQIVAFFSFV